MENKNAYEKPITLKNIQAEQKQIEQEVKLFMKDNELADSECFRVSWKNIDSTKLDSQRIREERPELYTDYGKVSHYRRFEVKAAQEAGLWTRKD